MKTATITFHKAKSYGAALQAYSLQNFLIKNGIQNKIIDYSKKSGDFRLYKSNNSLKNIASNIDVFFHKNDIIRGNRRFTEFCDLLRLTDEYSSYEQLKESPPKAGIYITGSDQVWSTGNGISPIYFLQFGDKNVKRISYAASMGNSNVKPDVQDDIRNYLSTFSSVSVREQSVKDLLSDYTDKNIEVNIDPTFLTSADDWRKLEKPVQDIKKPYILCFFIYRPEWRNTELKQLHRRTGKDIVMIEPSGLRNIYHNKQVRDAGPLEFLWLIDNADAVVTSSFHGVALSSIFGKPLYAIPNPGSPERITNLMKLLRNDGAIVNSLAGEPFNYNRDNMSKIIDIETERTLNYFKSVIGE